MQALKDTD